MQSALERWPQPFAGSEASPPRLPARDGALASAVVRIPTTLPEIGVAIRELLNDKAIMSREGLLAELQRRGLDLGIDPADTLGELLESDDVGAVLPLADERVI
jgi:hypothetical protein